MTAALFRLLSTIATSDDQLKVKVDPEGNMFPDWKGMLDEEYLNLHKNMVKEVHVEDFGAIGDGKTDNTLAFKKAIGNGKVKVIVPAGVFITKGIQLPSWTMFVGAGKGVTTIKLHDAADKGTRLITNKNHWKGNHHLYVGSKFGLECRKAWQCGENKYLGQSLKLLNVCKCYLWLGKGC